jgi:ferritin-like metal-binding protein YciE
LKALPSWRKAATNEELQNAFTSHAKETDRQIARLEKVFRSVGESVRDKKCDGIIGIVEEAKTTIDEIEEGAVLDAGLIAGGQRAEHYEIAADGILAHFADLLGEQGAKDRAASVRVAVSRPPRACSPSGSGSSSGPRRSHEAPR